MTGTQGYIEDFERLGARTARVPWVGDLRRRAMERFCSLGFPSTRDEEWKYTSLEALRKAHLRLAEAPAPGAGAGPGSVRLGRLGAPRAGVPMDGR